MARDYDPATGRYVESDPIGLAGGSFSTYAYVRGNPVMLVDEDGTLGHAPGNAPTTGPRNPWPPLPYNPNFGPQFCSGYYAPGSTLDNLCSSFGNSATVNCARACLHDSLPKDSCGNTKPVSSALQPPLSWYFEGHPSCWSQCRWPLGHQ
jgi:hypothetical protein